MPLKFLSLLALLLSIFHLCFSFPLSSGHFELPDPLNNLPNHVLYLISGASLILIVYAVIGCVCCPNKSIKALSYQNGFPTSRLNENNLQFENNQSEFAIFPPQSAVIDLQPVGLPYPGLDDKITFEPLPDIRPRKMSNPNSGYLMRPAHFRALLKNKISLHDWFDDPNCNFPRDQLQYINELGNGWFGRVVEGEASHINNLEEKTKVIVKILREDASPSEHLHFLYEVLPYRDVFHPNVIRLLGRCLESDPFLLIMEHNLSDLKSFLLQQDKTEMLIKDEILLRMAYNVAAGLRHIHKSGFTHVDLAAHNCFVCSDLTVKVGDYGIAFDHHKNDYYCIGDIALPIRWYAPEVLFCSENNIEIKEVTKEANVWAFGVVLWEIFEFGKLPYEKLNNEEVLEKVLLQKSVQLAPISLDYPFQNELFFIMKECWKESKNRPTMHKLESFLSQLYNDRHNQSMLESFEERWNSLQPKSNDSRKSVASYRYEKDLSAKFDYHNNSSDGDTFSSFENSYDMLNRNRNSQLSPSLKVFNGSTDELTENDACLNSISLGCSNDMISVTSTDRNISLLEDDVEMPQSEHTSERTSSAQMNYDVVLPAQSCPSSRQSTLERIHNDRKEIISLKQREIHSEPVNGNCRFDFIIQENALTQRNAVSQYNPFKSELLNYTAPQDEQCHINNIVITNCSSSNNGGVNDEKMHNPENSNLSNFIKSAEQIVNSSEIPNIIVHEAALTVENDDTIVESKDDFFDCKKPKNFRFVFKTDSLSNDSNAVPVHLSSQLETLKSSNLVPSDIVLPENVPLPLTSSPLKNFNEDLTNGNFKSVSDLNEEIQCRDSFAHETSVSAAPFQSCLKPAHEKTRTQDCEDEQSFVSALDTSSCFIGPTYNDVPSSVPPAPSNNSMNSSQSTGDEYFSANSTLEIPEKYNISKKKLSDSDRISEEITRHFNMPTQNFALPYEGHSEYKYSSELISKNSVDFETNQKSVNQHKKSSSFDKSDESKDLKTVSNNLSDLDEALTPELSLNTSYSMNDFKYSSTESTPMSDSFSNVLVESNMVSSKNTFDQYINSKEGFSQLEEESNMHPNGKAHLDEQDSRMQSVGNLRNHKIKSSFLNYSNCSNLDYLDETENEVKNLNTRSKLCLYPYEEVIVEDLETGEQTIIAETYSNCDDYYNSGESDEILKIDTETDEAIIVDSSEALVGFVPSRSIELLQEIENMPSFNQSFSNNGIKEEDDDVEREKELNGMFNNDSFDFVSSPTMKNSNYIGGLPEKSYDRPHRNFCLRNEVIEEEITEEITTPSSIQSTASFSSHDMFAGGEEQMSQSSESHHQMDETSIMPAMDHFYSESDEGSKTDISNSCSDEPHDMGNSLTDIENNVIIDKDQDVMHSWQPTQSVRWNSDETLEVEGKICNPVIIEGQEILAGSNGITMEDITTALTHMNMEDHLNSKLLDRLSVSPSPFSSAESSPCRDSVYTPDFESESDDTGGGSTSCSSTSGSFECIHNKFKNMADVSAIADESESSSSSREQSPTKVFSKVWDCHATPSKSVLVTPEKKFSSMRKSVSFHEEDPQVVFEYPPASYSSEEEEKGMKGVLSWDIDYNKYADWELQAGENEDFNQVFEIEELDAEPYVRRPIFPSRFSSEPSNRPIIYSLTSELSDDEFDLVDLNINPHASTAPSNSPEEGKNTLSDFEMSKLICHQLNNLAQEECQLKRVEEDLDEESENLKLLHFETSNTAVLDALTTDWSVHKINHLDDPSADFRNDKELSDMKKFENIDTSTSAEFSSRSISHSEDECEDMCPSEHDHKLRDVSTLSLEKDIECLNDESHLVSFVLENSEMPSEKGNLDNSDSESVIKNKCSVVSEVSSFDNLELVENINFIFSQPVNVLTSNISVENSNQCLPQGSIETIKLISDANHSTTNRNSDKDEPYLKKNNSQNVKFDGESECVLTKTEISNGKEDLIKNKDLQELNQLSDSFKNPAEAYLNEQVPKGQGKCFDEKNGNEFSDSKEFILKTNSQFKQDLAVSEKINGKNDSLTFEKSGEEFSNAKEFILKTNSEFTQDLAVSGKIIVKNDSLTLFEESPLNADSKKDPNLSDLHHEDVINIKEGYIAQVSNNNNLHNFNRVPDISMQITENSKEWQEKKESALNSNLIAKSEALHPTSLLNSSQASLSLAPEIIITPASESEDDQEDYLIQQLRLLRDEEDFSVTSQFTDQPFKDFPCDPPVGVSDYTEAFNFDFGSGDFFENVHVRDSDYSCNADGNSAADINTQNLLNLGMIEKSPDMDHPAFDSSLLQYTSNDVTQL